MFKKKKTYVILAIIILIAVGVYFAKSKKSEKSYQTAKAETGKVTRTVSVTGEVVPPMEVDLAFKLGGQIQKFHVNVGDRVEAGAKIATIDQGTLTEQLAQARYDLDAQKKLLTNMERRKDTYNYFQKEAQREVVKKYESAVQEIMRKIKDTTLYSPITGTIIKKNSELGEIILASSTPIVTIASEGELQVEVEVPESDIVNVKVGQAAKISLDALPSGDVLGATVSEIEPASTVISDVVYYKVRLKFDRPDERLKVGMSTDVDINTAEKNGVIMVPMRAVKNEEDKNFVEILKSENQTEKIYVVTGMSGDEGMIEIVSGLNGGEDVIILTSEK